MMVMIMHCDAQLDALAARAASSEEEVSRLQDELSSEREQHLNAVRENIAERSRAAEAER